MRPNCWQTLLLLPVVCGDYSRSASSLSLFLSFFPNASSRKVFYCLCLPPFFDDVNSLSGYCWQRNIGEGRRGRNIDRHRIGSTRVLTENGPSPAANSPHRTSWKKHIKEGGWYPVRVPIYLTFQRLTLVWIEAPRIPPKSIRIFFIAYFSRKKSERA